MASIREKAWKWCHSATSEPFADDKLSNSSLDVVVNGRVVGKFVEKHNSFKVGIWLSDLDLDLSDCIELVMHLSLESRGGGKRGKPAGGYAQWNQETVQKLASLMNNVQMVATAAVTDTLLKNWFNTMNDEQIEAAARVANSKMNDKYKFEAFLADEPSLKAIETQVQTVTEQVEQFKKQITDEYR
eukprot:TRINITY_DN49180_c0_g1_i1.p2 TRINITY_DN49180_c0_g1~~TRINITY_DN49180_c0_g1_i1.p2  ORF type:complete len:215 (+),score=51.91 TRINITY_DN49180_c0_g1_i1:90-647(+)